MEEDEVNFLEMLTRDQRKFLAMKDAQTGYMSLGAAARKWDVPRSSVSEWALGKRKKVFKLEENYRANNFFCNNKLGLPTSVVCAPSNVCSKSGHSVSSRVLEKTQGLSSHKSNDLAVDITKLSRDERLIKAMEEVNSGLCSQKAAATKWKVGRSTLNDWMSGKVQKICNGRLINGKLVSHTAPTKRSLPNNYQTLLPKKLKTSVLEPDELAFHLNRRERLLRAVADIQYEGLSHAQSSAKWMVPRSTLHDWVNGSVMSMGTIVADKEWACCELPIINNMPGEKSELVNHQTDDDDDDESLYQAASDVLFNGFSQAAAVVKWNVSPTLLSKWLIEVYEKFHEEQLISTSITDNILNENNCSCNIIGKSVQVKNEVLDSVHIKGDDKNSYPDVAFAVNQNGASLHDYSSDSYIPEHVSKQKLRRMRLARAVQDVLLQGMTKQAAAARWQVPKSTLHDWLHDITCNCDSDRVRQFILATEDAETRELKPSDDYKVVYTSGTKRKNPASKLRNRKKNVTHETGDNADNKQCRQTTLPTASFLQEDKMLSQPFPVQERIESSDLIIPRQHSQEDCVTVSDHASGFHTDGKELVLKTDSRTNTFVGNNILGKSTGISSLDKAHCTRFLDVKSFTYDEEFQKCWVSQASKECSFDVYVTPDLTSTEEHIRKWVIEMQRRGFNGVTKNEVFKTLKQFVEEKTVGLPCLNALCEMLAPFVENFCSLPECTYVVESNSKWTENYEAFLKSHNLQTKPQCIYSAEFISFTVEFNGDKDLLHLSVKPETTSKVKPAYYVTVLFCINGTGQALPPFIILPMFCKESSYSQNLGQNGEYIFYTETGQPEKDTYRVWLEDYVIPNIPIFRPVVILIHKDGSNVDYKSFTAAEKSHIFVYRLLQSGTGMESVIKTQWDQTACKHKGNIALLYFCKAFWQVWLKSINPWNIVRQFGKVGLYPIGSSENCLSSYSFSDLFSNDEDCCLVCSE